jgi:hypothetical protein
MAPEEYEDDYHGCDEYSVGLWFRWLETKRVPWEHLYTLTYNEPKERLNAQKAGDRLLSLFQYADGRMFFSTHSTLANDGFKYIFHEIEVLEVFQGTWIYAYFGYSR